MPGFPFLKEACTVCGGDAAIEFPEVPLHGAPDTFNMVAHAKVSLTMIVGLSAVPKPLHAIVARMGIGDEMATMVYPGLQEQLNTILLGVWDNLEAEPPCIYLNATHDNGLAAIALLTKPGLVYCDNAREQLATVWWDMGTEASIPALDRWVAHTKGAADTARTLTSLPGNEQKQ